MAEIAGLACPILAIDGDCLRLGNFRRPAKKGDFFRINLLSSLEASVSDLSLVVVTGVNPSAAELSCRMDQPTEKVLARLQQLMAQLPENELVDRMSRPAPFRLVDFNLQAAVAALPRLLPPSFGTALFVSLGGAIAWVTLSSLYTSVTSVTIDNGMVAIPPGPGVAPVETVVSTEKGLIDQLYAREGMPVVPGQPLFSTRHDPKVDFDLLDRSAARDLSSLDAEMRDVQDKIDSLVEQIALSRLEMGALPGANAQLETLSQKLQLARNQQRRRAALLREGAISQDSYELAAERVLDLESKQQQAIRLNLSDQSRRQRIPVLLGLHQFQHRRFSLLAERRRRLQAGVDERLAQSNQHPLTLLETATPQHLDHDIYKASSVAVVLRQLKRVGDSVQPNETVFVLQRDQLPPVVEAHAPDSVISLLALGSQGTAEIPAIRQRYPIRVSSIDSRRNGSADLRLEFMNIQANDIRQILALQGKPVKLSFSSQLNLLERFRHWFFRSAG